MSDHDHDLSAESDVRLLAVALILIVAFLIGEVVAGVISGSLALLSDASHMLTDVVGLGGSIWAIRLASRPSTDLWTFGLKRAEILASALNGLLLIVVGVLIAIASVHRLIHPTSVHGWTVVEVACLGVLVNLVATFVLSRANRSRLNVGSAFAHVLTDLWAFAGTAVAGIVIVTSGYLRVDAIASLLVVAVVLWTAWGLLQQSGRILLEATPKDLEIKTVRAHMLATDHVLGVHDLHIWVVTSGLPALSAHVIIDDSCFADGHAPQVLDALQACLVGHFDLEHSTFQLEPPSHSSHEIARQIHGTTG